MMDMPRRVRIGPLVYAVVDYTAAEALESGYSGEWRPERCEIAVANWPNAQVRAETLWHEVGHGIRHAWDIPEDAGEEKVVSASTKGLLSVMRDNPLLVRWTLDVLDDAGDDRREAEEDAPAWSAPGLPDPPVERGPETEPWLPETARELEQARADRDEDAVRQAAHDANVRVAEAHGTAPEPPPGAHRFVPPGGGGTLHGPHAQLAVALDRAANGGRMPGRMVPRDVPPGYVPGG